MEPWLQLGLPPHLGRNLLSHHLSSVLHQMDANDSQERAKAQLRQERNKRGRFCQQLITCSGTLCLPTGAPPPRCTHSCCAELARD